MRPPKIEARSNREPISALELRKVCKKLGLAYGRNRTRYQMTCDIRDLLKGWRFDKELRS